MLIAQSSGDSEPFIFSITDDPDSTSVTSATSDEGLEVDPVSLLQDQPELLPPTLSSPVSPLASRGVEFDIGAFGTSSPSRRRYSESRWSLSGRSSTDILFGQGESKLRLTTDAGRLLGDAPSLLGIGAQRRTPIVTDPRVRGNRPSRLAAAGSYWVPARIDLDTMVSKIDSRIVGDVLVIKGPYSVQHGPGFEFIDIDLLNSPRYDGGFETHGRTSSDYRTNGQQIYGRQEIWGGDEVWGFRVGYGHRTGNDYRTGFGSDIPSSYNSRDFDVALGRDLSEDSFVEFNYLRLDQTNVEFPGQAFDIDFLVTDGFDVEYVAVDQPYWDRLVVGAWYNQTRFAGSAQRPGKRRQFPVYDVMNFVGFTQVESLSTGFRAAMSWGDVDAGQLTAGADLYYVKQQLDEFTSGRLGLNVWNDANSPIPKSYSADPGLFVEYASALTDRTKFTAGMRADSVNTDVTDDPAKLASLGTESPQLSLAQILGSSEFDQSFTLWSAYVTGEHEINCCWTGTAGFGYAERPPNLTELYAAQPFMFLLQNGLNTVTGDPLLAPERRWQMDLGLRFDNGSVRAGARGFYAWMRDYITFEATDTFTTTQVEQINLQYVNTDRATLAGGEAYLEIDANSWLTPFATIEYVEGRDHTRNGDYATIQATNGMAKMKDVTSPRGFFSGLGGADQEPLPGIAPLESRLGIRLHDPCEQPAWTMEVAARVVDNQDRVASSLLETMTPGFTVWDLRGSWRPCDSLLLLAGVENFTDRTYREHFDFRAPNGIQVFQPGVNFYFGGELMY